jgi:hypothetical protein
MSPRLDILSRSYDAALCAGPRPVPGTVPYVPVGREMAVSSAVLLIQGRHLERAQRPAPTGAADSGRLEG